MSLKSLIEKMDSILTEGTKETSTGKIHKAEPGGYGRKDDEDDEGKKVQPQVKRGRGRPKKDADSDTGQVAKYDNAKNLQSFMVGNLPGGKAPGKKGKVHKIKDESVAEEKDLQEVTVDKWDSFAKHRDIAKKHLANMEKYEHKDHEKFADAYEKHKKAIALMKKFGASEEDVRNASKRKRDMEESVTEATKETSTGKIHKAEPGGYGRKDDEDDEGKKVQAQVKRGRGRPKKNADSDTGEVKKWDTDKLSSWIIGNKPKTLPGKAGVKHKLKDWMEYVEKKTILESVTTEGRMKDIMWADAESLSKEEFLDRYPEFEDFWMSINVDPEDEQELDEVALDPSQVAVAAVKAPGATQPQTSTQQQQPAGQTSTQQKPGMGATVIDFKNPNDPLKAALAQAVKNKAVTALGETEVEEAAPKGWEGTVKSMKKHKDEIDNPWALAHWMKGKGHESHKKESMNESYDAEKLKNLLSDYPYEVKALDEGWGMHESLYQALCDHYWKEGRIPRDIMYGPAEALRNHVEECYTQDKEPLIGEGLAGAALGGVAGALVGRSPAVQDALTNEGDRELAALKVSLPAYARKEQGMDPLSLSDVGTTDKYRVGDKSYSIDDEPLARGTAAVTGQDLETLPESELEASLRGSVDNMEEDYMNESKIKNKKQGVAEAERQPGRFSGAWQILVNRKKVHSFRGNFDQETADRVGVVKAKSRGLYNPGSGDKIKIVPVMLDQKQGVAEGSDLDAQAMDIATKLTTGKNLEKLRGMAYDSTVYRALDRYFAKHNIPETIYNRVASIVFKRINQQGVAEGNESEQEYHDRMHRLAAGYKGMSPEIRARKERIPGWKDQYDQALAYVGKHPKKDEQGVAEGYEQIDEVSMEKMLKYVPNAVADLSDREIRINTGKGTEKDAKKVQDRKKGLSRAAGKIGYKMAPESVAEDKDVQMESWENQLSSLLTEGMTITTSTGNEGASDSVSISATDADAQTLMKMLQNSGLMRGQSSSMSTEPQGDGHASVTVEPVSADEVMGTLQPDDDNGDDTMGFLKRMLGARGEHAHSEPSDGEQGDYEEEEMEEGNAFSGAVAKAKADGVQPGEKINVGGKEYPVKEEEMEEGNKFTGNLAKARASGKKEADLDGDGDMEKVKEDEWQGTGETDMATAVSQNANAEEDAETEKETAMSEGEETCNECGMNESECGGHGEQLDELSPATLSNYSDKARNQAERAAGIVKYGGQYDDYRSQEKPQYRDRLVTDPDVDYGPEDSRAKFSQQRYAGANRADAKLNAKRVKEASMEEEKLDEWANSPNDSDEKFLADLTYMTKIISGGLNNIKQDQTVLPSTRVKTQGETKHPDLTVGELIRKLQNIN